MFTNIINRLKYNYVCRHKTIAGLVRLALSRNLKRVAFVQNDRSLTYAQLARLVGAARHFLRAHGFQPGDRIAQVMPDSIESIVFRLACHLEGVQLALVPGTLETATLHRIFKMTNPVSVVTLEGAPVNADVKTVCFQLDNTKGPVTGGIKPAHYDIATINYSSGTTGLPKGILLCQDHWAASCHAFVRAAGGSGNRQMTYMPLVPLTLAGSTSIVPVLLGGAKIVLPEHRDMDTIARLIEIMQVNFVFLTPIQLVKLLDTVRRKNIDTGCLTKIAVGTDTVHAEVFQRATAFFGPVLNTGYGMAEVLPPLTLLGPEHYEKQAPDDQIFHSVGKPYPHIRIRVLDENGQPVPAGQIGKICIDSPSRARGYIGGTAGDLQRFRSDGSFWSEDYGFLDGKGHLYLLGRENQRFRFTEGLFYARQIEDICLQERTVQSACAVQIQNSLCVALMCVGKNDAPGRVTRNIKKTLSSTPVRVKIVTDMPETPAGKIDRKKICELFTH